MFIKGYDLILEDDYENYKIFIELVIESIKAWRKGRNSIHFQHLQHLLTFIQRNNN